MNLIWIISAKYLDHYRLLLTFNNGEVKVFDGEDIVVNHPLFRTLQNIDAYRNFSLDGWTVTWENGKLDLAPEYLYDISTPDYVSMANEDENSGMVAEG